VLLPSDRKCRSGAGRPILGPGTNLMAALTLFEDQLARLCITDLIGESNERHAPRKNQTCKDN